MLFIWKARSGCHTTDRSSPRQGSGTCWPLINWSTYHQTVGWYSGPLRRALKQSCILSGRSINRLHRLPNGFWSRSKLHLDIKSCASDVHMVTGALFAFCRDEVVQCFRFSKIPFNRFIFVPDLIVGSSFVEPPIKCSHTDHWWRSWEPSAKLLDKLSEVCPKPLSWTSREACSSMKRPSRKQKQRWIAETVWTDRGDFAGISSENRCCLERIRAVFRSF